jgi:hypothetical protein
MLVFYRQAGYFSSGFTLDLRATGAELAPLAPVSCRATRIGEIGPKL